MALPILEQKDTQHQMPATSTPHEQERETIARNMSGVKRRIAVHSGKGGVGKTFLAVNIAFALSSAGKRVGLLDADIDCPNVARFLNLRDVPLTGTPEGRIMPLQYKDISIISTHFLTDEPNKPMIVRGPIKHKVLSELLSQVEWGELDALIYDLPPGTSDVPMSSMLVGNLDGMVIVTTPQKEAVMDARKSALMAKDLDIPVLGIVENMSGEAFGSGAGKTLAKELGVPFLGSIPLEREIREANEKGKAILATPAYHDHAAAILHAVMGEPIEQKRRFGFLRR